MRTLLLWLVLCASVQGAECLPSGTVLFMYADNVPGKIAQKVTGDEYTHVAIVLCGQVYEAKWPRVDKQPLRGYQSFNTHVYAYVPNEKFSRIDICAMRKFAERNLGRRYSLKNYFLPNTKPSKGTWCSMYIKDILNQSRQYQLNWHDGYEPQNLFLKIDKHYQLKGRIK